MSLSNRQITDTSQSFSISQPRPILSVDSDSFTGDIGDFDGLDPIRIAFSVRNHSNRPLRDGDRFILRAALSEDVTYSNDDFILREFDINGTLSINGLGGLGSNLLPNENIAFDWIQQLPDNLEGDYYLLVNIEPVSPAGPDDTFPMDFTPTITIRSKNKTQVLHITEENNFPTERPSTSDDGGYVVYEQMDGSGIQQIHFRDLVLGTPAVRVSERIINGNIFGGNGHSQGQKLAGMGR